MKSLEPFNEKDEMKQFEDKFPQNLMNDMICAKLKEIVNLQDIIKTDELYYKSKRRKVYNFSKYSLSIAFLRNTHEGCLSLKDADDEGSKFVAELKNLDKDKKQLEKSFFK